MKIVANQFASGLMTNNVRFRRHRNRSEPPMKIRSVLSVLTVSLLSSCLTTLMAQKNATRNADIESIGKRDINKGTTNFSAPGKDVELGRQAAAEIEKASTIVDDSRVNSYVDGVAQNIARNSDSQFPISIKVIQSSGINAFALPGGFIYVTTGALKAMDNEAELAFVVGQMVGHIAARHATELNSRGTLLQALSIPSIVLNSSLAETAVQQGQQVAVQNAMIQFSKSAVKESDLLGLEYMYKAGYDPAAAISFLMKLQASELTAKKQNSMFDTHPPTTDRIVLAEKIIRDLLPVRADNILNAPEFGAIKAHLQN